MPAELTESKINTKPLILMGIIPAFSCTIAVLLFLAGSVIAAPDPPHDAGNAVICLSCHVVHNNLRPSLTKDSNENLCLSCHVTGGTATGKPFSPSMQAVPGAAGSSHRWDSAMPAMDDPTNQYGLRSAASLNSAELKAQLNKFENSVVCSVCHNQHFQKNEPWSPDAPSYDGPGTGSGRHMLRINNDTNEMCEDCHYYRSSGYAETDVRTYTGNKKIHPVEKIFSSANGETPNVTNPNQFNTVPLEPQGAAWAPQAGARYKSNGGSDANPTNNIILDANYRIRCLTCHGVHYTDSDASTIDQP